MWLRDYHLDGLRLDAVHALEDRRALHFLEELAAEVQALAALLNRELVLVAESDANDPAAGHLPGGGRVRAGRAVERRLPPRGARRDHRRAAGLLLRLRVDGRAGQDLHQGVLPRRHLVRLPRPDPRPAGRRVPRARPPVPRLPAGPRPGRQPGHRRPDLGHAAARPDQGRRAGLVLTGPYTPMLFMGEEWGTDTPWQYFTDHIEPWLAEAVAEGRQAEFAEHGWAAARRARPAGRGDLPALQAGLEPARPRAVPGHPGLVRRADRAAPGPARADRPPAGPGHGRLRRGRPVAAGPARAACASRPTWARRRPGWPWASPASACWRPPARRSPSPRTRW